MTSEQLKEAGMAAAAATRKADLEFARNIAVEIAVQGGITADDVGDVYFLQTGRDMAKVLGPATGSLFKTEDFKFTGERRNSKRLSNHARELKVWAKVTST